MKEIVSKTISEIALSLTDKRIAIKFPEPHVPVYVDCDALKISKVIRNLLSNAVKFTSDGSDIVILLEKSEITINSQVMDALKLSIKDKGPGVPKAEVNTIFEKFTQSSRTKTGAGGTGLGLAICREIIKSHSGEIRGGNNEKVGAVFSFKLPYEAQKK